MITAEEVNQLKGSKSVEFFDSLWRRGLLTYKLDDLQKNMKATIGFSRCDKVLILSSRQIGKSFLSAVLAVEYCIKHPGSIVRILAPTLKQVSDIVQDNLLPITADAPHGLVRRSKSDYRWHIGSSTLRLGALERAHVDNNRGGNANFVLLEEGGFVPSDDYRYATESVIGPQLLRSGGQELHISSPSEDAEHYLHTEILPYCEAHDVAFRYEVYDSPSISPRMIEKAIERCGGVDSEAFQREYLARIVRSPTLMVIPEFARENHVKEFEVPVYYNACLSIDMGGVRDKTAGYSLVWDFRRAKLLVVDELFLNSNTPTSTVIKEAKFLIADTKVGRNIFADVPGQVQIDMQQSFGFQIVPPLKQDRDAGINNLRLLFQDGKIEIHPRCVNLIGTLKTARYNNTRTDFLRTDAYGHADAVMALMYGARMLNMVNNPYPGPEMNFDHQMFLPHRHKEDDGLSKFAKDLIPWNPLNQRTN